MSKIKNWLNMAVNALSFIAFLSLSSSGLVLRYTLPPGSGHRGSGMRYGAGSPVKEWLGMTRHEWGQIHFIVAVIFLILLIVHLLLHWKWLYCTAWGTKANPQAVWRRILTLLILAYVFVSFGLPFIK